VLNSLLIIVSGHLRISDLEKIVVKIYNLLDSWLWTCEKNFGHRL